MNRMMVYPIVEGHGEVESVRILLQRIWIEELGGEHIEVLQPFRLPRGKMVKDFDLQRAINFGALKLQTNLMDESHPLILLMLDADEDCPRELGPSLEVKMKTMRSDVDCACIVANVEYETWFVAASRSLSEYLVDLNEEQAVRAEQDHRRKKWIADRMKSGSYSESIDQPRFTAKMSLKEARCNSHSFNKLCSKLVRRLEDS